MLGFSVRNIDTKKQSFDSLYTRFKLLYGTYPEVIFDVIKRLIKKGLLNEIKEWQIDRIFFMFDFLKNYTSETRSASDFDVDEKTFRKWVWFFLEKMTNINNGIVSVVNHYLVPILIY